MEWNGPTMNTTSQKACLLFLASLLCAVDHRRCTAFVTAETTNDDDINDDNGVGNTTSTNTSCINETLYCPELDVCLYPYNETCPFDLNDDEVQEFDGPERLLCYAIDGNGRCDLSTTNATITTNNNDPAVDGVVCGLQRSGESQGTMTTTMENESTTTTDKEEGMVYVSGLSGVYDLPDGCHAICFGCDVDPVREIVPVDESIIDDPSSGGVTAGITRRVLRVSIAAVVRTSSTATALFVLTDVLL
jgi:hypothetical protein